MEVQVLKICKEIFHKGDPSDLVVMNCEEFHRGDIELPYEALAVYYSLSIHRQEGWSLRECLDKLTNYVDYDMKRKSMMGNRTAARLENACNPYDLDSVVNTVCKLSYGQLNCLGY